MGDGMLNQLLSTLQPHEAEVLRLRYGLDSSDSHSQQEVSKILQIHSHTVKRYEHSALQKMRHPARAGRLSPYIKDPSRRRSVRLGNLLNLLARRWSASRRSRPPA